ncbi:MAG: hypothetical protein IPG61_09310 [bacterium]|nr:hypothetical protein [bacterium]
MNARIRILLALLGCLVFGGNALSADLGHCDPIGCDEPCEAVPLEPEDCACCAVRSAAESDPMLPSVAPPAPLPALLPELALLPAPAAHAAVTGFCPAPAPLPAPPRASVLRL